MTIDNLRVTEIEKCPECGSSMLLKDLENAEVVCATCGIVIKTQMADRGPEWRAFTPEERKQKIRVGSPETFRLHDKGLTTKIDWRDIAGFAPEKRAQLYRIRKWQKRIRTSNSSEKNLALALSEISRVSDMLGLPKNIVETSAITYRKAFKNGLIRGRSIKGMAIAATYLSCRQNKLIRSISDMSEASGINSKQISAYYRLLVRKMKIFVPPIRLNKQLSKLSTQLGSNGVTEGIAHKIILGAQKQKLKSGRSAKSIAAAACYIASKIAGDFKTQREIADAAELTEVTIRNRYREMLKELKIIISL